MLRVEEDEHVQRFLWRFRALHALGPGSWQRARVVRRLRRAVYHGRAGKFARQCSKRVLSYEVTAEVHRREGNEEEWNCD